MRAAAAISLSVLVTGTGTFLYRTMASQDDPSVFYIRESIHRCALPVSFRSPQSFVIDRDCGESVNVLGVVHGSRVIVTRATSTWTKLA